MLQPGRNAGSEDYRYGFNGKEKDDEISGSGNSYDYGFRIYNPRLGRFLSVDPLFKSYPWYTPYQFAGNMPVWAIDLDGLEELVVTKKLSNYMDVVLEIIQSDEVLTEVIKNVSDPTLKDKVWVLFAAYDFKNSNQNGETSPTKANAPFFKLLTDAGNKKYLKNTDEYKGYIETMKNMGLNEKEQVVLANKYNEGINIYTILLSSENFNFNVTDKENLKRSITTFIHELDLHMKNMAKAEKEGTIKERTFQDTYDEHYEGFTEQWYKKTGTHPKLSPSYDEIPKESKMGDYKKRIGNAVDKYFENKKK